MTGTPIDDLRDVVRRGKGRFVVFAGEGVAQAAGAPGWDQIAAGLLERMRRKPAPEDAVREMEALVAAGDIADAVFAARQALGDVEVGRFIEAALEDGDRRVPEIAEAIAGLRPRLGAVLTTCLDRVLDRAFDGSWAEEWSDKGDLVARDGYILKLRGRLRDRSTWVFSRTPEDGVSLVLPELKEAVRALLRTSTVLFVGCGPRDDIRGLLAELGSASGQQPAVHYAIVSSEAGLVAERLKKAGVRLCAVGEDDRELRKAAALLRSLKRGAAEAEAPPEPARDRQKGKLPALSGMPIKLPARPPDPGAGGARQRKRDQLLTPTAYLTCDREEPWRRLQQVAERPEGQGHVVLVSGGVRDGHSYLLERIDLFGQADLGAKVLRLPHDVYGDYSAHEAALALADPLEVKGEEVAAAVARILARENVVLLFPEADLPLQGEWLSQFYTMALPAFIARVEEHVALRRNLIVVQPVWWVPGRLEWFPPLSRRWRALRLLRRIMRQNRWPKLAIWQEELKKIEQEHIEALFRRIYESEPAKASQKIKSALELLDQDGSVIFEKLKGMTR